MSTSRGSVGVFNVKGSLVALKNVCPHASAPLCEGILDGTAEVVDEEVEWIREGEILRCPWHQWEFDLLTGTTLDREYFVRMYEVTVDGDWIYLHV